MEGFIMLSRAVLVKSQKKLWQKATASVFAAALIGTLIPIQSASAKAAQEEAARIEAQIAADVPQAKAGAQVIGAVVPFLPMEASGTAFARIFALNIGSSPTAQGSTTNVTVSGLPSGVTIAEATPVPTSKVSGWKCVVNVCSWVDTQGGGTQIQPGQTVEGLIKFSIAPDAQIASITDSEIQMMMDASKTVKSANDPDKLKLDALAQRLTTLKINVDVQGDTTATSQETSSYLAVTDATGRARIAAVISGDSAVSVGEDARWTARVLNIGSAAGPASVKVKNLLPSGLGLEDVRVSGRNWDCGDQASSLESCTYNGALPTGGVSEPLRIRALVGEEAEAGKENKWSFTVEGMPSFLPSDASFTAIEASAPDLGLQMIVGNQVIVPGGSIELHLQAGTFGGSTKNPVVIDITGVPGATVESISVANGENSSGFVSTDADGNVIDGDVIKKCETTDQGVVCQVRQLKKGELYGAVLSLNFPKNFTSEENSVVVKATLLTDGEDQDKTSNNTVGVPVVVQPANVPYPALLPAIKDESGTWNAFSGESVRLKSGTPAEFGYVIKNTGAKAFPVGTRLEFNLMLQEGVTAKVKGAWKCSERSFPAPQFTEEQRMGAATAARTAGVGFDLDRPASQLEAQLLEQIKEQATITPIPNLSGEVPGLACSTTVKSEIPVGESSSPAVLRAEVSEDADMAVALWRAELTTPALETAPKVDFSAITTAVKKGVAPMVVANAVRSGSVSNVKVSIVNKGELVTEHPAVVLSIPAGLRLNQNAQLPAGWKCVFLAQGLVGGLAVCTTNKLAGSSESSVAEFELQADVSRNKASLIRSVALTNSTKIGLSAVAESNVEVKGPLNVKVVGPETVNDVSVPVEGGEPALTKVSMSAQSSIDGVAFTWKQLCVTEGEEGCSSIGPRVTWLKKEGQSGEFVVPRVESPVDLFIQATANDNDASASDMYTVRLLPRPKVQAPPKVKKSSVTKSSVNKASVSKASVKKASVSSFSVQKDSSVRPTTTSTPVVVSRVDRRSQEGETTTTTMAPLEDVNAEETSNDSESVEVESFVPRVQGSVLSTLMAAPSSGSKSNASRIYSMRQLAALSVRANVLGSSVVAAERGKKIRSLAGLAGARNATWAWSFVNGPTDLRDNPEFQAAITAATSASLSVNVPRLAVGQTSSNNIVTLKVSATANGKTVSDILTVHIVEDEAQDVATMEQAIALDGVNRNRPVVLGVGGSVDVGAAVEDGRGVVWSIEGGSATISNESATGIKVTAASLGTSWVTAEVRDADGNAIDSVVFPVVVNPSTPFSDFCEQLTSGVKEATSSLAGFNINSELGASPDCEFNQTVEFVDKSLTLGVANLAGLSGSLSREGIFISSGTVESQVDLPVNRLVVKNLFIPFRQGNNLGNISGYLTGTLSESVLQTLQMETWDVAASVRISNGELKYLVVNGASKAVVEESTFSGSGTFGSDGSVLLEASVRNLDLFDTLTVNAEGSIFFPASGESEFSFEAGLAKEVSLAEGVELSEAALSFDSDNKVTGTGEVSVDRNGLTFDIGTTIELSKEKQELTFASSIPTLEPVTGLSLKNVEVSGKIAHITEGFAGSFSAAAEDITFASGFVVVAKPSISFNLDCTGGAYETNSGAEEKDAIPSTALETEKDQNGCDVAFGLTAGIEVGRNNPAKGSLTSSFDSAKKSVSFEGTLESVNFGSGVVLNELSLEVKYEDGNVSFTGNGDLDVLGAKVTATVLATKNNMVLRAGLSDLKPFGSDQISLESGEVIIVAQYEEDEKYTWTPKNDALAELVGDQELEAGDIKIAAIIDLPSEFENVKSLTKDRFSLPTKAMLRGEYSFTSGRSLYSVATADGSLTLSGAFAREAKGKPWSYDIKVDVPEEIAIIDGLKLKDFSLRVTNLDDEDRIDELSVTGNGAIDVALSGVTASVKADVEFQSTKKWTLAVSGTVTTFSAIPGLELNNLEFGGSITRDGKNFSGDLDLSADDVSFAGGMVKLVNPTLNVKVECGREETENSSEQAATTTVAEIESATTTDAVDESPATTTIPESEMASNEDVDEEVKDCGLTIDISMAVEVVTNGETYTGEMSGSVDTERKTATFEAEIGDISFTDDVTMTDVSARFDATDKDFTFVLNGALEVFGSKVSGRVTVGTDTAVLQASVKGLSPFGDNGPSITAGEVVIVLQSPAGGWQWLPIEDDLEALVAETTVAKKDIRIAVIVGMPDSIDQVESLTRGVVALPRTVNIAGRFNFGNGAIDLAASATSNTFTVSGNLSRANSDADWLWNVSLKTNREINLIPGFDRLSLTNLSFNITNKDVDGDVVPVTVNIDGALRLTVSNTSVLTVGATVRFAGTDDWNLTVTGAIAGQDGGTWEVIPGLRLPATQITGTVSKVSGEFSANLRVEQTSDWRPISAVTIRDMYIEIGVKRVPSTGWDFSFLLGGKLKVSIGSLVIPEMAITGGYQNGIWFLQVAVGNEVCHDVPVSQSANNAATPTPPTTAPGAAGATTTVSKATVPAATTTAVSKAPTGPAGQSVLSRSPSNSPPQQAGSNTNVEAVSTTVAPSPSDTRTERVCERIINVASGLEIIDATFRLQYDTNIRELSVAINGGLRILGFQIDASVKLSNNGLLMVAGVKNWELFEGGPTFAEMAVIFSTYDTNYTLATGYRTSIPGMDVTLVAQMAMPEGIKKTVGDVQLEPLKISMRGLLTGNIDLRIGIVLPPEAWIFKSGGYGLRLASVGLQLSIRNFADVTVGIYGEARLLVPNQTDQVPGRIAISFSSTGTLSINMSIGLDADGTSVPWQNVFGIDGLTINFAAFSFGINFSSTPIPTPEIGMAVSFQLPRALRNLVGMEDGINIEGAFFFSTTRGICLVVSVGQEPKVGDNARTLPKAIDLFNSNLIGNYMGIKFAPIGCTIAEKKYEPGISVGFSAAIMGVSFTALAKVDIKKLEMQVYANFDSFTIGGLKMKQTYLDLLVSGTSPLDSRIIFSGGFDLDLPAGATSVNLQVVAKLGTEPVFAIDGRIDQLIVIPGILEIRKARVQGLVKPTELRLFVNLEGDVFILGSKVTGSFRLDVDSSGVREVSANLNANINLAGDAVNANGTFAFTYLKGGFPKLAFAGTLNAGGRRLAAAEGSLDQYSFSMKANLDLGSVFKGQVDGKIVICNPDGAIKVQNQAGQMVTGATGDFYFNASATLDVGLAAAAGTVRFGRTPSEDRIIAQKCPVMAPTVSSANADQIMTNAMGSALRCAPGYVAPSTVAPTTSIGQTTTTTTPCPSTTTSTVARATTTTVRNVSAKSLRLNPEINVAPEAVTTTTIPVTTTTVRPVATTVPVTTTTLPPLPLAPRTTWGDIKLNANLNLGPLQGGINLAGTFDSAGNVNMGINGRLNVAPLTDMALSGSFTRTPTEGYTALLTFDGTVANIATVRFNGHIKNGEYEFLGTGKLNLGSVVQSDGVFRMSNIPGREGLKADVNFFAGNDATASVRGSGLMVFSGTWWDAEFGASFRTPIGNIGAGVYIGNMRVQRREVRLTGWRNWWTPLYSEVAVPCQEDGYPGGTVVIAGQTFCTLNGNQLDVRANLTVYGQNFGLGATITSNSFVATAAAPWWYDDAAARRGEEWSLNYLGSYNVFWFPFKTVSLQIWWGGRLTIQSGVPNQPTIAFLGTGKLRFNWYFSVNCNANLWGAFNPTYLGAGVDCGLGRLWVGFG
jgi:hypothetical protein